MGRGHHRVCRRALLCTLDLLVASGSVTPWTAALQAPLSMGFSGQEYWSGLPVTIQAFFQQSDVSAVITLSRFVIPCLPRSKLLFNFMIAVTVCSDFEAQENKICHCFNFCTIYLPRSDGTRCHDLSFLNVEFYDNFFHSPLSLSSRGFLVPLLFLPLGWCNLHI